LPTLDQIPHQQPHIITHVQAHPLNGKLADMGFTVGQQVSYLFKAPLGDPLAVALGDCTVTLRKSEAALIAVEPLDQAQP